MKIAVLLFTLTFSIVAVSGQIYERPVGRKNMYNPGTVIFKMLPEYRSALTEIDRHQKNYQLSDAVLKELCSAHGTFTVKLLFPHHAERVAKTVDLSLIGEFQFSASVNVLTLCRKLMKTGRFEYVEPRMLFKSAEVPQTSLATIRQAVEMLFMPNDSLLPQQWHLERIRAFDAWDLEKGDTSVLIGIVDSGVDYEHPDLADNIAYNYADPVNGVDDDNNGFVDDYLGWDFYHYDNDPKPGSFHGTAVAGVAAAVTNNGIGLAAPGFNSRILAVKVQSDAGGDNLFGFEGIVYAADRGCKVINCSWGGPNSYSNALNDIVRYATFDKNALVVSVAQNNGSNIRYYPGTTEFVLGVAATDATDKKESYSNFNHFLDLSAPGSIWSTMPEGQYTDNAWGTSFSAPLVAGAAAILAAYDPSLSAVQLGEQLRRTGDNIDAQNPNYIEQLGHGRLNMFSALIDTSSPAVRLTDVIFTDGNDDILSSGDTVRLSGNFINYLADVSDLVITITTPEPDVTILNNSFSVSSLPMLDTVNNGNEPFTFIIGQNIPPDTELPIRLGYQASGYDDWQWLALTANLRAIDIDNGVIATTS